MTRLSPFAGSPGLWRQLKAKKQRRRRVAKPKPAVIDFILDGQRQSFTLSEIAHRHRLSEKVWRSALHEWLNA